MLVSPSLFHNYNEGSILIRKFLCSALAAAAFSLHAVAAPYGGTPVTLPATIEAENFDTGGEGVGYHDNTPGNATSGYRPSESVDIAGGPTAEGGGWIVHGFQTGEWLAYTVNVPAAGTYRVELRAAHAYAAQPAFHIKVNGVNVTGRVPVPNTGGWATYQWVAAPVITLAAGQHVIKVHSDAEYFNLNRIRVSAVSVGAPVPGYTGTPYSGAPIALPKAFSAAEFDKGGQGVAYRDLTAGNQGGLFRLSEDVDIAATRNTQGAIGPYDIMNFQTGEWLAYTVNVPATGLYDLAIRAANSYHLPTAFRVEVDGVDVTGSIPVPNTGSRSNYQWVGKKGVQLAQGKRVLKVVAAAEYFGMNAISVLTSATATPPAPPPSGTPSVPAPIAGKGYRLVKDWDFASKIRTQEALRAEFFTRYVYNNGQLDHIGTEWSRYRDNNNHVFEEGNLALVARHIPGTTFTAGNVESGMLRSKWTGKYGYYEIRMKVPPGRGMWPAFWLNPQDLVWPPEIDVVEIVNNGRDTTANSYHFLHGVGQSQVSSVLDAWGAYRPGFDFKDDYHTFAVEWLPDRVRHYVDDKLVVERMFPWKHNNWSDGGLAHVLVNLGVGGGWPGDPLPSSLPAKLQVKHIRVWQK